MIDDHIEDLAARFRPTFEVGQRVRVNLGGECPYHGMPQISVSVHGLTNHRTGTVERTSRGAAEFCWYTAFEKTHGYLVRFDVPPIERLGKAEYPLHAAHYAPEELEPLD